jgi:hypothetical protein
MPCSLALSVRLVINLAINGVPGGAMAGVFAILFLAALVGVFKPYIPGWKRRYFGGVALVAFIMIGIFAPKSPADKNAKGTPVASTNGNATDTDANVSADLALTDNASTAAPESKWVYSTDKDEMRGQETRYATVVSDNTVDLSFPYGEVSGKITVRHRPSDGLNVMFRVDQGQILCNNFTSSHVSVKFDDNPIKRYECTGTSDGSSETAFIEASSGFLAQLKKSKKVIIEAEFFQKGTQQFTFQTAGLVWK